MEEREALERFAGTDEAAARAGFGLLCERSRPFLHARLRRSLAEPQDREDVIQQTYVNVWSARSRFRNLGVAAWHAWLSRTATRCCIDFLRGRELPLPEEMSVEEVADEDLPALEETLEALDCPVSTIA